MADPVDLVHNEPVHRYTTEYEKLCTQYPEVSATASATYPVPRGQTAAPGAGLVSCPWGERSLDLSPLRHQPRHLLSLEAPLQPKGAHHPGKPLPPAPPPPPAHLVDRAAHPPRSPPPAGNPPGGG